MKTKIIPFNLEMAKKIQAGEIEGKIKTKGGESARIICFDKIDTSPIVALVLDSKTSSEYCYNYCKNGEFRYRDDSHLDLIIEVPDNESQFKPFDKVLVRMTANDTWCCDFFSHMNGDTYVCICDAFTFCIPYEGNQELVGTCNEPKCK